MPPAFLSISTFHVPFSLGISSSTNFTSITSPMVWAHSLPSCTRHLLAGPGTFLCGSLCMASMSISPLSVLIQPLFASITSVLCWMLEFWELWEHAQCTRYMILRYIPYFYCFSEHFASIHFYFVVYSIYTRACTVISYPFASVTYRDNWNLIPFLVLITQII